MRAPVTRRTARRYARDLLAALPVAVAVLVVAAIGARPLLAQPPSLGQALDLESAGRYREAASAFRAMLGSGDLGSALLGLERAYASLGWTDSLLPVLDSIDAVRPGQPLVRSVQLRALLMSGHEDRANAIFDAWAARTPSEPQPYREYARLLLESGRTSAADSVLQRAQGALGSEREVALELAQLRAQLGLWALSARSWREALRDADFLQQAAIFALQPTPTADRDSVRRALADGPAERAARMVLARLELNWGHAAAGWSALSALTPDDSTVDQWIAFADEAESAGARGAAADALLAAERQQHDPALTARAATAAIRDGRTAAALELTEGVAAGVGDSALRPLLAARVQALSVTGRAADAERLVSRVAADDAGAAAPLYRSLAWAWVRTGDLERARAALARAGADPDDEVHGWLALYAGDLRGARERLRATDDPPTGLVTALALLARSRADSAPMAGAGFLALARGDTTAAASAFTAAATTIPDAASLLLTAAARLRQAHGDSAAALVAWQGIAGDYADSPEAAEAELAWARLLRGRGDSVGAKARLEALILSHPASALVPQARRELDLLNGNVTGAAAAAGAEAAAAQRGRPPR